MDLTRFRNAAAIALGVTVGCATTTRAQTAPAEVLHLTVEDAIARGEAANLQALLASASEREAAGARREALARLFPQIDLAVSQSREKINLASFGLPAPAGESSLIGPFNVFDGRVALSTPLFDARANAGARAARLRLESAHLDAVAAHDEVAAAVAELYLANVTARARIASADARFATAQAVAVEAHDRKEAGRAAGIDVLRAEVERASAEQQTIAAENAAEQLELTLARAIGVPPGQVLALDPLPYVALDFPVLPAALAEAQRQRPDLAAARAAVEALAAAEKAVRRERLPRLDLRASWGPSGPDFDTAEDTYDATAALRLPLFDGGRISGAIAAAEARTSAGRARLADLEVGVEVEVRSALLDAAAATRSVAVAAQALDLSALQLVQARDRFSAGVASSIEVTAAQEAQALADERSVAALEAFNRAKIVLARALGVAADSTARFLRGSK
ncbi:MAG: TolC family protein [Thermoanaerobaculia bacterium]